MAEYQRGTGPDALPQGEATALNAAQPEFTDPAIPDDIPVEFVPAQGTPIPNDDTGLGDDAAILVDHPDPDYTRSVFSNERTGRVPTYVVRHLPTLLAAAADPHAPPTIIGLKNSVIRYLEDERRRGG